MYELKPIDFDKLSELSGVSKEELVELLGQLNVEDDDELYICPSIPQPIRAVVNDYLGEK